MGSAASVHWLKSGFAAQAERSGKTRYKKGVLYEAIFLSGAGFAGPDPGGLCQKE
jgi:hypothetical protein